MHFKQEVYWKEKCTILKVWYALICTVLFVGLFWSQDVAFLDYECGEQFQHVLSKSDSESKFLAHPKQVRVAWSTEHSEKIFLC